RRFAYLYKDLIVNCQLSQLVRSLARKPWQPLRTVIVGQIVLASSAATVVRAAEGDEGVNVPQTEGTPQPPAAAPSPGVSTSAPPVSEAPVSEAPVPEAPELPGPEGVGADQVAVEEIVVVTVDGDPEGMVTDESQASASIEVIVADTPIRRSAGAAQIISEAELER